MLPHLVNRLRDLGYSILFCSQSQKQTWSQIFKNLGLKLSRLIMSFFVESCWVSRKNKFAFFAGKLRGNEVWRIAPSQGKVVKCVWKNIENAAIS